MDTGRVYFISKNGKLQTIRALTLECHLRNVARLVEVWDARRAYLRADIADKLARTCERLVRAAQLHDKGKPSRFKIYRENGIYKYSYSGHRFDVMDDDAYVQWLIRLHHNAYSVDEITEAVADLRLRPAFQDLAENFPLDSYTLQMCDQIEAEAENYALDESARHTPFMEFKTEKLTDNRVGVDPFPFWEEEIPLTMEFANIPVDSRIADDERELTRLVKEKDYPLEQREVVLCRLM